MGERQAERPVIYIDLQKAHDLDRHLALQKLYYRPEGYYQTAEKMQTACKRAGYGFTLAIIKNWLNRLCIRFISLVLNIFLEQVLVLLLLLMKFIRRMLSICLMIK